MDRDLEDKLSVRSPSNTTLNRTKPEIIDFEGPADKEDPHNWSPRHKWATVCYTSLMSLGVTLGTSILTPAVPQVLSDFGSPIEDNLYSVLLVSVWALGETVGPLVIAPLSELYGRYYVYHASNILFIAFSIGCATSPSLNALIVFRFFNGMACAPNSLNPSIVGDMFVTEQRGKGISIMGLLPILGPVLGPLVGSYLSARKGWRWTMWLIAILGIACELMFLLWYRETYKVTILEKRAKKLRKQYQNEQIRSKYESPTALHPFRTAFKRPMCMLLTSAPLALLSIYTCFVYGCLFLVLTTLAEVFIENYGFTEGPLGLTFLGLGLGTLLGLFACRFALDRLVVKRKSSPDGMLPEHRLLVMLPSTLLLPLGLLLYGWSAEFHLHWIVPIIGTSLIGFSLMLTTIPNSSYLVDAFGIYAASALAASTISRDLVATVLPLAGPPAYARLGVGWGNSVLALIALVFAPLPLIVLRWGQRMRKGSRRWTSLQ